MLDTSIYGMIQQPKVASPFEDTQQALTIKNLIEQNAMRPQMQQLAIQKQLSDIQHQQATTGKATAETHATNLKVSRDMLASASNQDDVNALKEFIARTHGPQAAAQIPNFDDPNFQSERAKKIMDADALLKRISPEYQSVDTGSEIQRTNPYTNEIVSRQPKQLSPTDVMRGKWEGMIPTASSNAVNAQPVSAINNQPSAQNLGGISPKQRQEISVKRAEDRPKDLAGLTDLTANLDRMKDEAAKILNHPSLQMATGASSWTGYIPGTGSRDVSKNIDNLKSQVAFSVLQAMRNASKTGGALGAVSERELDLLQSNLSALDQSQTEKQFADNLKQLMNYIDGAKDRAKTAYENTYGEKPNVKEYHTVVDANKPKSTGIKFLGFE